MKFEDILPELRSGRAARRSAFKDQYKYVRIADPRKYPQLDGDREVHQVYFNPSPEFPDTEKVPYGGKFDTEAEAKAFLVKTKKANTLSWTKHKAYQDAVRKNGGTPSKELEYVPMPTNKPDAFEDAEIRQSGVMGSMRLGAEYFVILDRQGILQPWNPTHSDLLENDWNFC